MTTTSAAASRRRRAWATCCWAALLGAAGVVAAQEGAEVRAVRQTFENYKAALVAGDAASAVSQVDADTLRYFEELRGLAASGTEDEIRSRSFVDRLLVLSIRHTFPSDLIASLSLEELMAKAVADGWIAPQTVAQLQIGEIVIEGDRATGEAMTSASAANPDLAGPVDGLRYEFVREDGAWFFRFGSLVQSLNALVEELTGQLGGSQDDLLFMLIESFSGEKVLPEVWDGPGVAPREPPVQ